MKISQTTKGNEFTNSTLNQPVTIKYMLINIYLFRMSFYKNKYNRTITVLAYTKYFKTHAKAELSSITWMPYILPKNSFSYSV